MGYDLYSNSGPEKYYRYNVWWWGKVLTFADMNGWVGSGTKLFVESEQGADDFRELEDWDGGYCSNDGQEVTEKDAGELADAIEKGLALFEEKYKNRESGGQALMDLGDESELDPGDLDEISKELPEEEGMMVMLDLHDPDSFEYMSKFVDFCRQGSFNIH